MGSRACTRCNHPPRYCQCEIYYYLILLAVSLVFPIAELIIGKMLARSSLVLLDGLDALAHGAFFYFAFQVSKQVHEEFLSIFEEERRRKLYAAIQSAFLVGGMVLFLFLHVFGKISEPEEQNVFFTIVGAGVGLAGALLSLFILRKFKKTRETNLTYNVAEIHIHADIWTSLVPIAAAPFIWAGNYLSIPWIVYLDPFLTTAIAIWFIAKSLPYLLPR